MLGGKNGLGGGEGNISQCPTPSSSAPPPARLFTNPLPVKHPRWRHRKPYFLPRVPLQNNACTAGYLTVRLLVSQTVTQTVRRSDGQSVSQSDRQTVSHSDSY